MYLKIHLQIFYTKSKVVEILCRKPTVFLRLHQNTPLLAITDSILTRRNTHQNIVWIPLWIQGILPMFNKKFQDMSKKASFLDPLPYRSKWISCFDINPTDVWGKIYRQDMCISIINLQFIMELYTKWQYVICD